MVGEFEVTFPRQKLGNGRWIMFGNSVIVPPYERANRSLRGQDKS